MAYEQLLSYDDADSTSAALQQFRQEDKLYEGTHPDDIGATNLMPPLGALALEIMLAEKEEMLDSLQAYDGAPNALTHEDIITMRTVGAVYEGAAGRFIPGAESTEETR